MSKISDNGKKKVERVSPITAEDILAMYEAVLPLLYDNPIGTNAASEINVQFGPLFSYDFLHYAMESERGVERLETHLSTWRGFGNDKQELNIAAVPKENVTRESNFKEVVQQNYDRAIKMWKAMHPDPVSFHYYRIESKTHPRIAIGFFRSKDNRNENAFTKEDKQFLDRLAPHLFRLYRTVLTHLQHSATFRYFDSFSTIGSRIAKEYGLSETETRLLPDILYGYSNEEIAKRQFVSVATVKTHVNHILKKTGTKNRADFITKFFTSPENVQL